MKSDGELLATLQAHMRSSNVKEQFNQIKRSMPPEQKYLGNSGMTATGVASATAFFHFLTTEQIVQADGVKQPTRTVYSPATIKMLAQEWDSHMEDADFQIVANEYYLWPAASWTWMT